MKYKNKDGIELNYTGNDVHTKLVKEVISEAITILDKRFYPKCKEFLKENFNIEDNTDGR